MHAVHEGKEGPHIHWREEHCVCCHLHSTAVFTTRSMYSAARLMCLMSPIRGSGVEGSGVEGSYCEALPC